MPQYQLFYCNAPYHARPYRSRLDLPRTRNPVSPMAQRHYTTAKPASRNAYCCQCRCQLSPLFPHPVCRRPNQPHHHGCAARARKLPALRSRSRADAASWPARTANTALAHRLRLHALNRLGATHHDECARPRQPQRRPALLYTSHRTAAAMAKRLAPQRLAALRQRLAATRTATLPRLVSAPAPPNRTHHRTGANPCQHL